MSASSHSEAVEVDALRRLRHDLRTPINHIIGYAELAQEDVVEAGHPGLGEQLGAITGAARRLTDCITRELQPERLQQGGRTAAFSERVLPALNGIASDIRAVLASLAEDSPGDCRADVERMLEAAERLTARIQEGISLVAAGATPAASAPSAEARVALDDLEISSLETGDLPVLIADDTDENRDLLRRQLKKDGFVVHQARDGREVMERLGQYAYQLILLDIMMPHMDGYAVLEAMANEPKYTAIPVIVLTSIDEIDSVVRCMQLGADDYLTKPLNGVLLKARIEGLLERRRALQQLKQLGSYTLEEKVGQGAMADVYRARHAFLKRPTAVKVLSHTDPMIVSYFEREVQVTSRLSHPNTIAIYDYGRTPEGRFYYAMEYLDGMTLGHLVKMGGALPAARAVFLLKQICRSLIEAHSHGLIHRDVKSGNVMLCERGGHFDVVKVCDFGLVMDLSEEGGQGAGSVAGTPLYMAPEAFHPLADVDARTDIYAVGVLAYYLVCGRLPFRGDGFEEIKRAQCEEVPAPPSQQPGCTVPMSLEAVILKCLAKDPAERHQSAVRLLKRLDACDGLGSWAQRDAHAWWTEHLPEKTSRRFWDAPQPGTTALGQLDVKLD